MLNRTFIACASSLCLTFAATSVLADTPAKKKQEKLKTQAVQNAGKTSPQVTPITQPAPAQPGNLASHLGLGKQNRIQINGFLSAGGSSSNTSAKYNIPGHGSINNHLNFTANSLAGLQITGNITKQLAAVLQLVANGDDINGNKPYSVNLEWAFLRYSPIPQLQFRAGRFRLPAFLYSDTEEIGYTYPWTFLPTEVYRMVPLNNMNGFDVIYSQNLGQSGWVFKLQPYIGQSQNKYDLYTTAPSFVVPPGTTATFNEDDIMGGVATLSNQYLTLRANYARMKLSGYIPNLPISHGERVNLFNNEQSQSYSFAAKFDYRHVLLVSEYAHRQTPNQIASMTGYYATAGYRIGKFLPIITYARLKTTNVAQLILNAPFSELPQSQYSYTLGGAYYINSNLVAKVGVSQITPTDGTNGLFTSPPGMKHTYLYSASLDAIF